MERSELPKHSELSLQQLGFLNHHFNTHEDLSTASRLFQSLTNQSSQLDADLLRLRTNLTKLAFSWISPSFHIKTAFHNLNFNIQNVSLQTSKRVLASKKIQQILIELAQIAKESRRIETIHKYIDTALRLEALVGDLEDAVFSSLNQPNENIFSAAKLTNSPITTDFRRKEKRLHKAIKALNDIEQLLIGIAQFQPQWHHLLTSVDIRVDKSLVVIRPQIFADYRTLLASIGWPPELLTSKSGYGDIAGIPNPLDYMQGDLRECYCHSFLALCDLQLLQTRREKRQLNLLYQECDVGLWAINELVSPIASRIEYHFLKWVEQPEYIFALVYKITRDLIVGVDYVLGPLIDKARVKNYSAKEAWVSAVVQTLLEFLTKRVFPALAERYKEKNLRSEVISSWLHLIDLMVSFDKQMQLLLKSESCLFSSNSEMFEGILRGKSLLMIFYDRPDWLKVWAKVELKEACKKLKADLKDEKAWLIDNQCNVDLHIDKKSEQFLLSTREDHRSPVIADSALKIAWEMIQRCKSFPAILPRQKFIRSTAARFIWYFLNVLLLRCKKSELSLDCPADDTLMTMCGSINAARYVESKLREWSDDVNFLEMTSFQNDSGITREDGATDYNCFFREEISCLLELETNWLMEMIAFLLRQFETLSCEYIQNKDRFEQEGLNGDSVAKDLASAISIDFVEPLDDLRSNLRALNMNLNRKDFMDLWRSIADGLDHFIFCSIFTSKIRFSSKGINQFRVDMQALFVVFQPFCARPEAFFPCIRETLKLLKISMEEVKHLQVVSSNDRDLSCYGVSHLSFDQVHTILRNRKL
ncbi:hypothetical protein Ddye_022712 [Dipteronia dyeriana]|uniref:RINT1-like protein MAG2L n=1 Tax=Dipteronia dyeriana TaxID=168575 RepID=A0AAD9WRG0_9ROSI|nr:hypothetical protein Ddye_022712 [Dipteronia dyeriana]